MPSRGRRPRKPLHHLERVRPSIDGIDPPGYGVGVTPAAPDQGKCRYTLGGAGASHGSGWGAGWGGGEVALGAGPGAGSRSHSGTISTWPAKTVWLVIPL